MNKKFLSVVLFGALMAGSSVTFTGCIDNDEPAGIENLRGAKAELLKAKAAVETANAAYRDAETQLKLAEVEKEKLTNESIKLANQLKELELQEKTAKTEAAIAEIQAKLEQNKLKWEAELLKEKETLAVAQKAYEDAMKALELSKTYLSEAELKQLEAVEKQLGLAKTAMETAKAELEDAYDAYKDKVTAPENYINEATLKEDLLNAQTELDKATNKLAIKKEALAALESDDAYNAWLALKAKYNAKIDSLNAVLADKETAKAKIIAENTNGAIKDLQDAVTAMDNIIQNKKSAAGTADSTFTVSEAINEDLIADNQGFITYKGGVFTANFKSTQNVLALTKTNGNDKSDELSDATAYATLMDNTYGFADGNGSVYKAAVDDINKAIKTVNDAKAAINANEVAYAKEVQAAAKKAMDEQKKVADAAIKVWNDAVTAYNSGTSYSKQEYDEAYGAIQILLEAVKNETTGYTSDEQIQNVYNKYVSFRAVMTANGQKELPEMPKAIKDGKTLKEYLDSNAVTALLPTNYTEVDLKANLLKAATTAFGKAGIYNDGKEDRGVLVQPKDDEIKKIENFGSECGAQGLYLAKVDEYNTATENVEKAEQFDKAIAQLTKWKSSLSAAKNAYVAKYQEDIDAVSTAQNVVTEKVANPINELKIDATKAMKDDIQLVIDAIDGDELKEYEAIIKSLKQEIGDKKGVDGATESTGLNKDVEDASEAVLKAEKMLELFNAGNLKEQYVIEWAQAELERAKAAYENKVEVFNYWNGKLEEMMKALYSKASAE